eukprot:8784760-Alexandrium_andersonii.AAC.1
MPAPPSRLSISVLADVKGKGGGPSRVGPEEVLEARLLQEGARAVRKALNVALSRPIGLGPTRGRS